ncbi:MAG: hypothetical protein MJZ57_01465 [Bacteroidales bacterium]|nr:hypothetical protein [Bacteroidales bacterium]
MRRNNDDEVMSKFKNRTFVVLLLVLAFGFACVFMLFHLAFSEGAISTGNGDQCLDMTLPENENAVPNDSLFKCYVLANDLRPERGEIYDERGRLLVGNFAVFEVAFDGKNFRKEHQDTLKANPHVYDDLVNKLAHDFYRHFKDRYPKYDEQYYHDFFAKGISQGKYRTLFSVNESQEKSWVTSMDTAFIRNLNYLKYKDAEGNTHRFKMCLNFISTNVRINPYGEMARRTLGMNNETKKFGLEYTMDSVLAGQEGSKKFLKLNNTVVPLKDRIEPIDGYNIHTTLNLEIQNAVHNELAQKLSELNAEWGCAIVMETTTGEIKAISNLLRSGADENTYYSESMEYAMNAKVEPGSTFKLASLLAYFENGGKDDECIYPMFNHVFEFPLKSGAVRRYAKSDSKVHGETLGTPNEIFQRSSNIGVASIIVKSFGMKNFAGYRNQLEKFGFFDTIHTQLGDLMPASIRNDGKFDNYYAVCFGAGFHLPVMRTLMFYNAVANGGKMMSPLFVKYVTNNYDTIERYEPKVIMQRIASEKTLAKARAYLDSVVWGRYGTGRHYKDSTCMFAGKTGTRDLWDAKTRTWIYDRNAVSFCGYFPKDAPIYTMIVYIYDVPQHSEVAVDAFGRIARAIMNSANFSAMKNVDEFPYRPLKLENPINRLYFNKMFSYLGYDTLAYPSNTKYWMFVNEKTCTMAKMSPKTIANVNGVPDVRGLIASDAIAELTRAGYKTSITGRGVVKEQTYDKERRLVRLHLEPI